MTDRDMLRVVRALAGGLLRLAVALCATCFAMDAIAQDLVIPDVDYPSLVKSSPSAEGFVPKGWKLESQLKGDLNGDGLEDLVLVLHEQDARNRVTHDGLGENPVDTNPRILAVAFAQAAGGYVLALENHELIPRHDDPVLDDVLDESGGVFIKRGTLQVALHMWASAGSWGTSTTTYTFRWQNARFELIGYHLSSLMRNSGETSDLSINYSTGQVKRSEGSAADDTDAVKSKATWEKLSSSKRWTIDSVGDGMDFQPLPD